MNHMLYHYLKDRSVALMARAFAAAACAAYLYLCRVQTDVITVLLISWAAAEAAALTAGYLRRRSYFREIFGTLERLDKKYLISELLPPSARLEDQLYREILYRSGKSVIEEVRRLEREHREYREFIESWIHEAKVPLTNIGLLSAGESGSAFREIREKEFGIYMLLGFRKKQIARLFLMENMVLGAVALVIGTVPGIFFQQVLTSAIYGILETEYTIHFSWDIRTFAVTAGVYAGAYVLALFRNQARFRRMDIRELVDREHENEKEIRTGKGRAGWIFFAAAAYILAFGWMLYGGRITQDTVYPLILGLLAAVYLLYAGLASFLVLYIRHQGALVWRGTNLFVLRQLSGKVRTMRFTMGTLTILFAAALVGTSCALMLNRYQMTQGDEKFPFDAAIYHQDPEYSFEGERQALLENTDHAAVYTYQIYQNGTQDWNQYLTEHYASAERGDFFRYDTYMKLSDYNALREMLGYEKIGLGEREYLLQAKERIVRAAEEMTGQTVKIGGVSYKYAGCETIGFEQNGHNGADYLLVVPDDAAEEMTPYYSLCMAMFEGKAPEDLEEKLYEADGLSAGSVSAQGQDSADRGVGTDTFYSSNSTIFIRDTEIYQMRFMMSVVMFPLFYIGLVFLCTALTVLAVQQLSDSAANRRRYGILQNMGLTERELSRTAFRQTALYYLCPFIGALLLGGEISLYIGRNFLLYSGVMDAMWSYFGKAALLFGIVYLLYFGITCEEFNRRRKELI